jgi:hypothetical protein
MPCVNRYTTDSIDECRTRMDAQLAAYRALVGNKTASDVAVQSFEPLFFANLVAALEGCFVHRSRTLELKDGNALNEVRTLSNSIINNRVMAADKTIKYDPSKSVLKIAVGEEIRLNESGFVQLLAAFLSELEAKFA